MSVDRQTLKARGIPELHLRHVFDELPKDCTALSAVRDFLDGPDSLLVLAGGIGTCKTGSACWALTQKGGKFIPAGTILKLAMSKFPDERDLYRKLYNCDLLVIDDLGTKALDGKDFLVGEIDELVNARYSACVKTIITTNHTADGFKAAYGERVADRIRESGRFLELDEPSVRGK